jgi:hypothetical protein
VKAALCGLLKEEFGAPVPWEQLGELRLRHVGDAGEKGDLKAVAPLTRLVAALDRYHGLAAAKAHRRPAPAAPLPAPAAPPLALPAPPPALTNAKTGVDKPLRE